MAKKALSPIHEDYSKLDAREKRLLAAFGILPDSLRGETDLTSAIIIANKIEKLKLDVNQLENDFNSMIIDILSLNKFLQAIENDVLYMNKRISKLENPPVENLPNQST